MSVYILRMPYDLLQFNSTSIGSVLLYVSSKEGSLQNLHSFVLIRKKAMHSHLCLGTQGTQGYGGPNIFNRFIISNLPSLESIQCKKILVYLIQFCHSFVL